MPKFDFSANRQQAEKQFNLGKGEYFKVKDGDNKIRLVSECLAHPGEYQGKPTFKWLCQVIDLQDKNEDETLSNKVKPYFMPDGVYQQIMSLQMDTEEGYDFDEIPMPYNINIVTTNAGDKSAKYAVRPSPKRVPLTEEQLKTISEAPTVQELQNKIREADTKKDETPAAVVSKAEAAHQMEGEINVDEIPF